MRSLFKPQGKQTNGVLIVVTLEIALQLQFVSQIQLTSTLVF